MTALPRDKLFNLALCGRSEGILDENYDVIELG
jgi:hypothetical protein